jgi:hypothetical protein
MAALAQKADIRQRDQHVRFVPIVLKNSLLHCERAIIESGSSVV